MPNLLVNLILIQLTINQFILNINVVYSEHNHHLSHHSFEKLNNAIYHQLLAVESNKTKEALNLKNEINNDRSTDQTIVQPDLNDQTINHEKFHKNLKSPFSQAVSHSILKSSINNHTSLDFLNSSSFIGSKQFDTDDHSILNSTNFTKPTTNLTSKTNNSIASKLLSASINLTNLLKETTTLSPRDTSHTNQSRAIRSSNNQKLTELVRRSHCTANKDCVFSNSCIIVEFGQNLCKCPNDYINVKDMQGQTDKPINWPIADCYQAQELEKLCMYDEQCIVKHSKCTRDENLGSQLHCACPLGFASKGKLNF